MTSRHISPPPRELSQESLARVRRKRLARRVNAKVPMFAEHFIQAELARKPEFYDGITDPDIEQRKQAALEQEWAEWQEFWSRPNKLVVYAQEPKACRQKAEQIYQEMQAVREKFKKESYEKAKEISE